MNFRRLPLAAQSSVIKGQAVDMVTIYKSLSTMIDGCLKFDFNTYDIMLCKKGHQHLSCLRKLSKFKIDKTLTNLIKSDILFSVVCWYGNLGMKEKNTLAKM